MMEWFGVRKQKGRYLLIGESRVMGRKLSNAENTEHTNSTEHIPSQGSVGIRKGGEGRHSAHPFLFFPSQHLATKVTYPILIYSCSYVYFALSLYILA